MKYLLILLLCWFPMLSYADITARVVAIRGDVSNQTEALQQGSTVDVGDTIVTSDRSFAVLQFIDGAKIMIRPNSTFIIDEYDYESATPSAELNLVAGGLRIITGAIAKSNPENYTVETPVALMGVRGTEFSIYLCGDSICKVESE